MGTVACKASDVAKHLIYLSSQKVVGDSEEREGITNLKLQKILYFAQACSLAQRDRPLFSDPIEAWEYGPVVPKVYQEYREHTNNPIIVQEDTSALSEKDKAFVVEIWKTFGGYSAGKLVDIAHAHEPWKEAYRSTNKTITQQSLREYYKSLLA